ncbi:hypothetical protein [Corallococcus sp. EGB]|uniref:hypothetical protein n=1 Tax=Corallococcus sp. EGB TaxID=1521117 RepID=UPI001CC0E693|nr:hypothetical protein [Corallococcus sp. EGB]
METVKLSPKVEALAGQYGKLLQEIVAALDVETSACQAFLAAVVAHGPTADVTKDALVEWSRATTRREETSADAARASGRVAVTVELEAIRQDFSAGSLDVSRVVRKYVQRLGAVVDSGDRLFDAITAWLSAADVSGVATPAELEARHQLLAAMDARKATLTREALAVVGLLAALNELPKALPTEPRQ